MSDTVTEPEPEVIEAALAGELQAIQKLADLKENVLRHQTSGESWANWGSGRRVGVSKDSSPKARSGK